MNVLDLASGSNMAVTKTSGDESPSFSPNGELIVYATVSGRQGVLAMASAPGFAAAVEASANPPGDL